MLSHGPEAGDSARRGDSKKKQDAATEGTTLDGGGPDVANKAQSSSDLLDDGPKTQVKRFLSLLVDNSPNGAPKSSTHFASLAQPSFNQLNPPDRHQAMADLPHEMPKLRAANNLARVRRHNQARGQRQRKHIDFLDQAWAGRENWAPRCTSPTRRP
ncbi:hypothetical protein MRS44_018124 [Fusarium solani]|uniref:uncharacterized protein n=1 Tax=Fusarium solani TaxID=169388 RepID=UPI0032C451F1|nr:hypothetical protein MRS44_018124 [Fusarium solani]